MIKVEHESDLLFLSLCWFLGSYNNFWLYFIHVKDLEMLKILLGSHKIIFDNNIISHMDVVIINVKEGGT